MKKLLWILLLAPLLSYGQYTEDYELKIDDSVYTFDYTPSIKFILDDFFQGIKEYGIPLDRFKDFKGIHVTERMMYYTGTNAWGVTDLSNGVILLNGEIPRYLPLFMSAVIYHEMYHFYLDRPYHCIIPESTILNVIEEFFKGFPECPYTLQDGYNIEIEKVIQNWGDDEKEEYFRFILFNYLESKS